MNILNLHLYGGLYKRSGMGNNEITMKKLVHSQQGFIPLLIMIMLIVVAFVVIAYLRVQHAHN